MPASTNYKLKDFGFGTGGTGNSSSSNYLLNAITGEQSGAKMSGTNYNLGPGLEFTNQANVPAAPVFTNPGNYYNKLQIVLNTSDNPTDTEYAIAISTDNFVTETNYVQNDNTVGSTLGIEDYQTYVEWGGASGFFVVGLSSNTTYYVKVKAMQGKFTETNYGPVATAATVSPTLTFDIDVSATDTETDPPFSINFGDLVAGSVTDSPQKIWIDLSTYHFYGKYKRASVSEVNEIAGKVGKIMMLPNESPTLATVTDVGKLKNQSFFANAENGDKVLIFPSTQKAILYRPGVNKIIEVAFLTAASQENAVQAQPEPADNEENDASRDQASQPAEQAVESANVAVYNGTEVKGMAADAAGKIAEINGLTVVKKDNAAGNYESTVIVNLNGKDQAAREIADNMKINEIVSDLPDGEKKPDADILVIIGKDFNK